jgi:hypothetical protein
MGENLDTEVLVAIIEAAGNVTAATITGRSATNAGDTAASIFGKVIREGMAAAQEALAGDEPE